MVRKNIATHQNSGDALSHDELLEFFDSSIEPIAVLDQEGRFKAVNPAWTRILGYDPSDLSGRSALDLIHADDRKTMQSELRKAKEGISSFRCVSRIETLNGGFRWFVWSGSLVNAQQIVQARDITEFKEMEQMLRETAAVARIGGWSLDVLDDSLWWSDEAYGIHGNPPGTP